MPSSVHVSVFVRNGMVEEVRSSRPGVAVDVVDLDGYRCASFSEAANGIALAQHDEACVDHDAVAIATLRAQLATYNRECAAP